MQNPQGLPLPDKFYLALFHRLAKDEEKRSLMDLFNRSPESRAFFEALLSGNEALSQAKLVGHPPGHFYSPVVSMEDLGHVKFGDLPPLSHFANINFPNDGFMAIWDDLRPLISDGQLQERRSEQHYYYTANPVFPGSDALMLQTIIRKFLPKRIIEVGSGFSTACMFDTFRTYNIPRPNFTMIQPYPAVLRTLLPESELGSVELIISRIQDVELQKFDELAAGDILFIDSTHVVKTGSDVVHEVFEILPRLKPGVLVHFHDIFYPFEYPVAWVKDRRYSWNELYFLRAFLENNHEYDVYFFNNYFNRVNKELASAVNPILGQAPGGSLWLIKR